MIGTVIQGTFDAGNRITGQHAGFHRRAQTFFDTGNVFLRNITADNGIFKFKSVITFNRFKFDFNLSKLTGTTGLFLVGVFDIGRFGNRFAVSNLRLAHIAFDLKLAFQTVDNNLQMEFAHAFDDCLTGIRVGRNFERRIFHRQSGQSQTHFLDIGLGLRFDSQFNNRFGENHVFQNNRL